MLLKMSPSTNAEHLRDQTASGRGVKLKLVSVCRGRRCIQVVFMSVLPKPKNCAHVSSCRVVGELMSRMAFTGVDFAENADATHVQAKRNIKNCCLKMEIIKSTALI